MGQIDSEDAVNSTMGVIANSGVAVVYFPFSNYTYAFGEEIETTAFIQSKGESPESSLIEGAVRSGRSLDVIMSTKIFQDNEITPSKKDKLKIGGISYYLDNFVFYAKDGRSIDTIEDSILVSFNAVKREGLTRNNLTQ